MQEITLTDADGNRIVVDNYSGALSVMDVAHYHIHEGLFYTISRTELALADNASITFYIVPNQLRLHLRVSALSGGDGMLELFENPTVSANGTAQVGINRNRYSANVPDSAMYYGPTVTGDGTRIFDAISPGGYKNFSTGGEFGLTGEYVLNHDRTYLARMTNLSGQAAPIALIMDWYENPGYY